MTNSDSKPQRENLLPPIEGETGACDGAQTQRLPLDPAAPLVVTAPDSHDGLCCIVDAQGVTLMASYLYSAQIRLMRQLVRAFNVLHGVDDEEDKAFGVALQKAANQMYRRQADKAAERINAGLLLPGEVKSMADIIYEEMGTGSLISEDKGVTT